MKAPLLPIPEKGAIDFTKRIRNCSVRYLNNQKPTKDDMDKWVVLPLYQKDQDMPLDGDGKTSILVAHVEVMRQILVDYEKKMMAEEEKPKKRKIGEGEGTLDTKKLYNRKAPTSQPLNQLQLEEGEIRDESC